MKSRTPVAMGRRLGMSPEARERQKEVDAAAIWHATCRKCKKGVKGTLAQLRKHVCDNG